MRATVEPPALFLETLGLGHVHDVRRLDARVHHLAWSVELWRRELARPAPEACYVAASIGGRHVGHAGLLVQATDGHIVTVAVDPDHQRQGIASQLVLVLTQRAAALGLQALTLEVRHSNRGAQGLYRRFGFGPTGIRPDYYADDGEDALIMWAHDVSEPSYSERLETVIAGLGGRVELHPLLGHLLGRSVDHEVAT